MESIETADLIELIIIQREMIASQTQFWLSVTFAVIAASFLAGARLTIRYRLFIGLLYVLATAMSLTASAAYGQELLTMHEAILSRGVNVDTPVVAAVLRFTLMGLGTVLTLTFLYHDRLHDEDKHA